MRETLNRLKDINSFVKFATSIIRTTTKLNQQVHDTMQSIQQSQDEQHRILDEWNTSLDSLERTLVD